MKVPAIASLKSCLGKEFRPVWATWRVGVDLLFERTRSREYLVAMLSINLIEFSVMMLYVPRVFWVTQHRAYWYADCIERPGGESVFSQAPCMEAPITGPMWELLLMIAYQLFQIIFKALISNPFRSRLWFIPALWMASVGLCFYVDGMIYLTKGPGSMLIFNPDSVAFAGAFGLVEDVDSSSFISLCRHGVWFSHLLTMITGYAVIDFFLIRLLISGECYMLEAHQRGEARTEALLHGSRNSAGPCRCQDLCDALEPTYPPEVRHYFANLLYEEEKRLAELEATRHNDKGSVPIKIHITNVGVQALTRMRGIFQRFCGKAKTPAQPMDGSSRSPSPVAGHQHRLPALVLLSAVFSIWAVSFTMTVSAQRIANLHAAAGPLTSDARKWASAAVQASEQSVAMTERARSLWELADEQYQRLLELQRNLTTVVQKLEPLPELLLANQPTEAAQIEDALDLLKEYTNLTAPSPLGIVEKLFNAGPGRIENVTTKWMLIAKFRLMDELARLQHESTKLLCSLVNDASEKLENFVYRLGVSAVIGGIIAFLLVIAVLVQSLICWPHVRQEIATGHIKSRSGWNPAMFHPVLAPGLPGMLASSMIFAFYILFATSCLIIQAVWWSPELVGMESKELHSRLRRMLWTIGVSVLIKSFILDKFIGRRLLTNKRGFVTNWSGFAWYIIFVVPVTICSGVALALTRFILLICIAAIHVVRLDLSLFPPKLQSLDSGYTIFMSSVLLDHQHRNPVWMAFVNKFYHEGCRSPEKVTEDCKGCPSHRAQAARRKWHLAVTLANNPQLATAREKAHSRSCQPTCRNAAGEASKNDGTLFRAVQEGRGAALVQNWVQAHNSDKGAAWSAVTE